MGEAEQHPGSHCISIDIPDVLYSRLQRLKPLMTRRIQAIYPELPEVTFDECFCQVIIAGIADFEYRFGFLVGAPDAQNPARRIGPGREEVRPWHVKQISHSGTS